MENPVGRLRHLAGFGKAQRVETLPAAGVAEE
jgi:hypothetical protein